MKRIEASSSMVFLIGLCTTSVLMLVGICFAVDEPKAQVVTPPALRSLILPRTAVQKQEFAKWQGVYGYDDKVQLVYNSAFTLRTIDQHSSLINRNRDFIVMILSRDDPNSLASTVVVNKSVIEALIRENVGMKRATGWLQMQVKELSIRIEGLEEKNKTLENVIGDDYGKFIRDDVAPGTGPGETVGDSHQPKEGVHGGVDRETVESGSGSGSVTGDRKPPGSE